LPPVAPVLSPKTDLGAPVAALKHAPMTARKSSVMAMTAEEGALLSLLLLRGSFFLPIRAVLSPSSSSS